MAVLDLQPAAASTDINQITSIEAFMAQHADTAEADQRSAAVKRPNAAAFKPVPVAVSARSSKNTAAFHQKMQALGLPQPKFEYGGGTVQGWDVSVDIEGETLQDKGPYGSKQEAKEMVCGRALELIVRLEIEGKVSKPSKKRKAAADSSHPEKVVKSEPEPGPNYVGMLLEFQNSKCFPATYQDYQVGTQWSCTLFIEGLDQIFGAMDSQFPSKKGARQNAAKTAVEYFQSQGKWPNSLKKRKGMQPPSTPNVKSPDGTPAAPSYASRVAQLATRLGLESPMWHFENAPQAPGFHTVTCTFKNGGRLEGPLGEVRHVYGKKAAKEECARAVLGVLIEEMERRRAYGEKVMAGVANSDAVVDAPAKVQLSREMDVATDSDDEFEDAEEELHSYGGV